MLRRSIACVFLLTSLALLPLGFHPSPVLAAENWFTDSPVWRSVLYQSTESVALGDLDGDGDLDLVCGNYGQPITAYRNQGGVFKTSPFWNSSSGAATSSVALGDIDGDGDLDIVCGNSGQPSTVYRNQGGLFETEPAWSSGPTDNVFSIALGDLDGDGDLDLVCGNFYQPVAVYRNQYGLFETQPSWRAGQSFGTTCVALGDVDGDGDLDLVCGNAGWNTLLYRNEGGVFETVPGWNSGPQDQTWSASLGDVDGDGDLDLVTGNMGRPPALYRNQGGAFELLPLRIGTSDNTVSVALGDVDVDGDLDLVCGNLGRSTALYRNQARTFESAPVWKSGPSDPTRSVVLGDLDGDGHLDLICGNYNQPVAVYRNQGQLLATQPAWKTEFSYQTECIALGDLDSDGDLDLVCANYNAALLFRNQGGLLDTEPSWTVSGAGCTSVALGDLDGDDDLDLVCGNDHGPSTAYRNLGGFFETEPFWSSGQGDYVRSIALGDLDGDGDLDLVCGNGGRPSTAYRNLGGLFETEPFWSSGSGDYTSSVALGDIDGDGDLDLVCGYDGGQSTAYRNLGGIFETEPAWRSGYWEICFSVALGDVDGDGDLDLVCGNGGRPITAYRNLGGLFETEPFWSSGPGDNVRSIALGDLDGDGDLDLICGGPDQPNAAYRNLGGLFEIEPAWRSGQSELTRSVALGDVDGDGDLDLVCGNSGHSTTAYLGVLSPPYRGDLSAPTNQLPSNPAYLRFLRLAHPGRNLYQVDLQAMDVESDPVWIVAEWQHAGVPTWNRISFPGSDARLGPLASSPVGVPHSFDWDVSRIPADGREVVLRLRTISYSHTGGPIQHVPSYAFQAGALDIRAPRIRVPSSPISFLTTTAGDTSLAILQVSNLGTEPLILQSVHLPSPHLWTNASFPDSLEPGTVRQIPLYFAPRDETEVSAALGVSSNDALQPLATVPVRAEVRPLAFTVANLYPAGEIQQGVPFTVSVVLQDSVQADTAWALYRRGGEPSFASKGLVRTSDPLNEQYTGTVPADLVGTNGIEYQVQVSNGSVLVTSELRHLRVRTTNVAFPSAQPKGRYRLITVPQQMEGTIAGSLLDDLGGPDPTRWRLFAYDSADSTYQEAPGDRTFRWELGRGYWMVTRESVAIDTGPEQGLSTPTDSTFALPLVPGWNLIGHPFAFPVAWDRVWVEGGDPSRVEPPVRWNEDSGGYDPDPVSTLQPFEGYWVRSFADSTVVLRVPPEEVTLEATSSARAPGRVAGDPGSWRIHILASSGPARDDANTLGISPGSSAEWDPQDRSDPPLAPGASLSVFFPHPEWNIHPGVYTADIRPWEQAPSSPSGSSLQDHGGFPAAGRSWAFEVRTAGFEPGGVEPVRLEFEGVASVPSGQSIVLIDRSLARTCDLRADPRYTFYPSTPGNPCTTENARFELRVGSEDYVVPGPGGLGTLPGVTRLLPNRPNPFRSSTVIRFEVAKAGPTVLSIYDLQGRLIRTLDAADRLPGRYEVAWEGEDERGTPIPAGVYFLRLSAPGVSQTHKVLRIE